MTSTAHSSQVKITTTLLYGIFVFQKSYLIGCRNLMKREHAEMLANKVIGSRLPQELVDLGSGALYDLEREIVRSRWIPQKSCVERNVQKFEDGVYDSPVWRRAEARISAFNITTTKIQPGRPMSDTPNPLPYKTYIHLSCRTPSIAFSLPSKQTPVSPAIFHNAGSALVRTRLRMNDPGRGEMHEDETTYLPSGEMDQGSKTVGRLVLCEGIEEAVKGWGAESVGRIVEVLDLRVIPFDIGDPMRPGFHLWQKMKGEMQ